MTLTVNAAIEITGFSWVPDFAKGQVRDLRPRWALEEANLDYSERLLDATTDRPDAYYQEQPWGQVPVLREAGQTIFETGAILLHLGGKDAQLLPVDARARNRAISWVFAALNSIEPLAMQMATIEIFAAGEQWAQLRKPSLTEQIAERLDRLATNLGDKAYLDTQFTVGDIAMATVLRILHNTDLVSSRATLAGYVARCEERPAFQRALQTQLAAYAANEPQHG